MQRFVLLLILGLFLLATFCLALVKFDAIVAVAVGFGVILACVSIGLFFRHRSRKVQQHAALAAQAALRPQIDEREASLRRLIQNTFLVQPCSSCAESRMMLLELSPNARSVQYQCLHCGKKMRAVAGSPNAAEATSEWSRLNALVGEMKSVSPSGFPFNFQFETARAPLPYEQTTREAIPPHMRSEVWRRDQGKCTTCGSKSNLQFDHIIPVSRGGATSVQNLQLLCLQCNVSKAATI